MGSISPYLHSLLKLIRCKWLISVLCLKLKLWASSDQIRLGISSANCSVFFCRSNKYSIKMRNIFTRLLSTLNVFNGTRCLFKRRHPELRGVRKLWKIWKLLKKIYKFSIHMITKCKWYLFYTLGYRSLRLQRQIISNFTHLSQILRLKLRDLSLTLALDACLPFPRPFAAHVLLSNNLSCQPYISNSFCLFLFCNPSQRYSHPASNGDKTFFFTPDIMAYWS